MPAPLFDLLGTYDKIKIDLYKEVITMQTFIIALDGASPDLINEWIDEGHLKNLAKIKKQGLSGELESTFPPLTGPAWSSFHTGVNPGKHGVFTWLDLTESYRGKVINGSSIRTGTVWDLIGEQNGKVGLLSVPVTYPPEEVNGFVVPGFLTPSGASNRSYPSSLIEDLLEEVPDFEFLSEPYVLLKRPKSWVENTKKAIRNRGKAARYLYEKRLKDGEEENKIMMTHFFGTDMVQHFLWDKVSENWDPRLEVFKAVDKEIGRLKEKAPEDSVFIIVSDHGFGPIERTFNVNSWLEQEGLLELKNRAKTRIRKRLAKLGFTEQNTRPVGECLYPLGKLWNIVDNPIVGLQNNDFLDALFLTAEDVDWEHTLAYSRSHIGHIRLNLSGREKKGIVAEKDGKQVRKDIMDKISQLKVPGTDKKLAQWVKVKEELYQGRYLPDAPDILFNPLEGEDCHGSIVGYGANFFYNLSNFSGALHPGHHRRNGILMACGKGIEKGEKDASIMDIAPTVLNLNSFEIPEQMDGQVIEKIAPASPEYCRLDDFYKEPAKSEESEEVRERMESLGYL